MPMKTTFDLPESLVADVKRIARARGTTSRELVRQALSRLVDEDAEESKPFKLRDMSVKGGWPDLEPGELTRIIRDMYDERLL
jgi:predicted transcriptional regulator